MRIDMGKEQVVWRKEGTENKPIKSFREFMSKKKPNKTKIKQKTGIKLHYKSSTSKK